MVRWMCGIKLKDRLPSKELRERLGIDDIALVLQQNSTNMCMGMCCEKMMMIGRTNVWSMMFGVQDQRRPGEVVREDCEACKMNKEDAMDHCKWRKMIKDVR